MALGCFSPLVALKLEQHSEDNSKTLCGCGYRWRIGRKNVKGKKKGKKRNFQFLSTWHSCYWAVIHTLNFYSHTHFFPDGFLTPVWINQVWNLTRFLHQSNHQFNSCVVITEWGMSCSNELKFFFVSLLLSSDIKKVKQSISKCFGSLPVVLGAL